MASVALTKSVSRTGANITSSKTMTADLAYDLSMTVTGGVSNSQFACAFDQTKVQFYYIKSSRDMTLEFNNSTTGVPTLNLKANEAVMWYLNDPHASLFTAAVTTCYATLAAGDDATLEMLIGIDPT